MDGTSSWEQDFAICCEIGGSHDMELSSSLYARGLYTTSCFDPVADARCGCTHLARRQKHNTIQLDTLGGKRCTIASSRCSEAECPSMDNR